eukprot:CAMPEP_0114996598 /NCGR_PEP_ID=MMETSP0216-20121206/14411_1 /TAXON_ID=223996 /ORGANISM="Protocruzia adherens, Strain Boccale" /LENGTH=114 /DNA_ID=CAMNT_0002360843 /DNA_START=33 /DNA_END=377 /DNA_ORIENTATION=+
MDTTQAYKCTSCGRRKEMQTNPVRAQLGMDPGVGWREDSVKKGLTCKCGGKMYVYLWQSAGEIKSLISDYGTFKPSWFNANDLSFVIDGNSDLVSQSNKYPKCHVTDLASKAWD